MVVEGTNPHYWWSSVSAGITRDSFCDLRRMKGWVGPVARGYLEIWWYHLPGESESDRSHGSTTVYPLCFNENILVQIFSRQCMKMVQMLSFLVDRIFPHSDRMRIFAEQILVFSPDTVKHEQKNSVFEPFSRSALLCNALKKKCHEDQRLLFFCKI